MRLAALGVRAVLASTLAAAVFSSWVLYMNLSIPGDHSYAVFMYLIVAVAGVILALVALPAFWMGMAAHGRKRRGGASTGLTVGATLAGIAAAACWTYGFSLLVPGYFDPPYESLGAKRDAARDFTAPWGVRMNAVTYGPRDRELAGRTLWVAETELTRGEHARLVGSPIVGDAALPATGLAQKQVVDLIERANRDAKGAPAGGRFRLPTIHEAYSYSGDWWITGYPKSIYRCASGLTAAAERPANGLGLRGTTDNAAEIVFANIDPRQPHHCATLGSVEPHCALEKNGSEWREKKGVGIRHCTGSNANRVFEDPAVGVRLVFEADPKP